MHAKSLTMVLVGLFMTVLVTSSALADDAKPAAAKAKITFADQVTPIFRSRCNSCHNADKQKGGLNLESFTTAMQGGGSGKVIEPGDAENSSLLQLVMHKEEPKMPPNSSRIPDAEIEVIRAWIDGGALETAGSVAAVKAKPKFEFKLDPSAMGKPVGEPAMPDRLPTQPIVESTRAPAIVAMASSPWAPLVAIGGFKQVIVYNTATNHLAAILPFPEGSVHVLKFSRSGALLLAGGGRGGQSGLAVAWDVKTGKRVFEVGKDKEYDVVLAADISPDHGQVALGGPGKVVRVYSTADGQLQFELRKHTEWITALEFSPDGVLLATGDRNNGLLVWEAQTGREFFDLRGHTAAITDISWRLDSNVFASSSEDGSVKLWEMENGNTIKSWGAHGGGVESVRFAKDGRLITTGRDRLTRVWDQNGGKQRDFEAFNDLALDAVFTHDEARVIAGDWSGEVRVWDAKDGRRIGNLAANPAPVATRLDVATKSIVSLQTAVDAAQKALAPLEAAVAEKAGAVAKASQAHASATQAAGAAKSSADAADKSLQARAAEEKAALDAIQVAQAAATKAQAGIASAEKAVTDSLAAEKSASEALTSARAAVETALARKTAQDKALADAVATLKGATNKAATDQNATLVATQVLHTTELAAAVGLAATQQAAAQSRWEQAALEKTNAPTRLEQAKALAASTAEGLKSAQMNAAKATEAKNAAAKVLADARTAQQAADAAVAARKAELDKANADKAGIDKSLADARANAERASATLNNVQTEIAALKAELAAGK